MALKSKGPSARGVRRRLLPLGLVMAMTAPVWWGEPVRAQDADRQGPAVKTFKDWGLRCRESPTDQVTCYLFQNILLKEGRQRIFHVAVGYINAQEQPIALMTSPLGTYLPPGVALQIDDGEPMRVPFEQCNADGCHATLPIEPATLEALKRGALMNVAIHDGARRPLEFPVSLAGFTAGFRALREANP